MANRKTKNPDAPRYDSTGHGYVQLPRGVTSSPNYSKLSTDAKALIQDANSKFNGRNNGDISLPFSTMRQMGWSKRRLIWARQELEYYDFLEITKQGGRHTATLYALGWINVQPCNGKHDVSPTREAPMRYQKEQPKYERPKRRVADAPSKLERSMATCLSAGSKTERVDQG